jgi:hypothetical protein
LSQTDHFFFFFFPEMRKSLCFRFWSESNPVSWRPGSEEGITAFRGSLKRPLLAIVGRPNVGKSNLFNRICGRNKALVSSVAGTTRDLLYGNFEWMGQTIDVVDTGGMFQEIEDFFSKCVMEQARMAASEWMEESRLTRKIA